MRRWAVAIERRPALVQGCLGGAGFAAETLAEVLVIETLGPSWIPVGLAGAAVLSLTLTAGLARRPVGPRRLPGLAGAALVAGLVIWAVLFRSPPVAALAFLFVSRPLRDALTVTFGNLVAARYDPQAAKRALPRLAAVGQTGAIATGLILPVLLRIGGAPAAVLLWPVLAAAVIALSWNLPRVLGESGTQRLVPQLAIGGARSAVILRHSSLLRTLAVAAMLAVASGAALGLSAAMVLSTTVRDPIRLASLYALIGTISNVGVLLVQTVGLPVLLGRLGTARVALLPPTIVVGIATWVVAGGGLAAGLAAQAGRLALRPALQTPIEEIMLGLLPVRDRAAGRAWLRGGAVPIAGLTSSLGLTALVAFGAGLRVVAGVALATALGGLFAAIALRRQHRHAALALARGSDLLDQRMTLPALGGVDASVIEEIVRRLEASERDDERLLLVALLADLDPATAVRAVAPLLPVTSPSLAASMLASLAERKCPTVALLPQAPQLLNASSPAVRRAALAAFASALTLEAALVAPLLDDPDGDVALAAVERLVGQGGPIAAHARQRLLDLAQTGTVTIRATAAGLLAKSVPAAVASLLSDPAVAVRRAAALAAGTIGAPPDTVTVALNTALHDEAPSVRTAAIAALVRLGPAATPALGAALDDPSLSVRVAATTSLLAGGASVAGGLAKHLPADHSWGRATVLAVLTRWRPWRWRAALIVEESARLGDLASLATARVALGPPRGPVGALLRRDLDDAIADGLARWGECLAITEDAGPARIMRQGLAANDLVVRSQAQEALEAVRSPLLAREAAALLALVHSASGSASAENPPDQAQPSLEILGALMTGGGWWRRMLLTAAACEEPGLYVDRIGTDPCDGKDANMLSLVERATLLRGVPPFADLSSEHLRLLAEVAEEIESAAGETLFATGSDGDRLFVIVTGQIALEEQRGSAGSVARIGSLGPGAALGEDAVFDGGTHVLDATTISDCRLLTLRRDVLMALLDEQPALARTLIAWLSARLRETTGKLAERTRTRPRAVIDLLDRMEGNH